MEGRLLAWYAASGRDLPWRRTRDPYAILVSEVMAQQTQMERVLPRWVAWLERWPTVEALAAAPAADVIREWQGLGYNRRAVALHRAAQHVAAHGWPEDLTELPGVGRYTADAVSCFAFGRPVLPVDVNVRRVLSRAVAGEDELPLDETKRVAADWLAHGEAYRWNQALMDVGAMVCRIDAPLCTQCPLKLSCLYRAQGKNKLKREPRPPKQSRFEGSSRQKRGGIVDHLRKAAEDGVSMSALGKAIHPDGGPDLTWLVELLEGLESDGLVEMTPSARRGSGRGIVRLPG